MVSQQSVPPQEALKRLHVMINVVVCERIKPESSFIAGTKIKHLAHRDWSTCI